MKRLIFMCAMLLGITCMAGTTPKVTATANAKGGQITVTSDTTENDSIDFGDESVDTKTHNAHFEWGDNDDDNDMSDFKALIGTAGVAGTIIAGIVLIMIFGFPLFLVVIILYFISRNRKAKYDLAREALKQGKEVPQSVIQTRTPSNDELWKKGIKNIFLGLGLMMFLYLLTGTTGIAAIGFLVLCTGAGQAIIAKTTGPATTVHQQPTADAPDNHNEKQE